MGQSMVVSLSWEVIGRRQKATCPSRQSRSASIKWWGPWMACIPAWC